MGYKVDNAVILAAGTSSRFAPLSYELPKALIPVRGEILIERQIRQLREAGIWEIVVVVGYKKEYFAYLKDKYSVILIENTEYDVRNNHSSIYAAKEYIKNTYICSADNYFERNPFELEVEGSYYSALYAPLDTSEWCMQTDGNGNICAVTVGGRASFYMYGHVFWDEIFSKRFLKILEEEYFRPETREKLWETIFIEHIRELPMKIRPYTADAIFEFDSLEELREFDPHYREVSGSKILQSICESLGCTEQDIIRIRPLKGNRNRAEGFSFCVWGKEYSYQYLEKEIKLVSPLRRQNERENGAAGTKEG